ncbi:Hypothetical protein KVN_LOCUS463 [uncultured virus]|nr:Hypothetical protein KVN_LOCUS463 [uncultured virus]
MNENENQFNLDEYEFDPEENEVQESINLLNIYLCYFKNLHNCKPDQHMFTNVDSFKKESTNKCIELFYDEISKYKQFLDQPEKIKLCEPDCFDINEVEELYLLLLNYEPYKVCQTIFPILNYLSTLDWVNIEWSVIPLKK